VKQHVGGIFLLQETVLNDLLLLLLEHRMRNVVDLLELCTRESVKHVGHPLALD
jgi:hypothetical protein